MIRTCWSIHPPYWWGPGRCRTRWCNSCTRPFQRQPSPGLPSNFGKKVKILKFFFVLGGLKIWLHMYLKCEGGGAELWPLPTARLARVLGEGSCRASQRRMTRMRTKARTEKDKAAVPKVTPVAGRQENTANTFKSSSLAFSFHSVSHVWLYFLSDEP